MLCIILLAGYGGVDPDLALLLGFPLFVLGNLSHFHFMHTVNLVGQVIHYEVSFNTFNKINSSVYMLPILGWGKPSTRRHRPH